MDSRKEELVLIILTIFTLIGFSISGQSTDKPAGSGFINAPTAFKSTISYGKVDFNWKTFAERENDHFAIQRSKEGTTWETIALIPSSGDSFEVQTYLATDPEPTDGDAFYRVKQTSLDGTVTYSVTHDVTYDLGQNGNRSFDIFPNPTEGTINFNMVGVFGTEEAVLFIIDMGGRVVSERVLGLDQVKFSVDTGLSPGLYTVVLSVDEQLVEHKEVVVL